MSISAIVKMLAIVIVGLFIVKLASAWATKKFPNKVTESVNTVIQTA